MSSISTQPIWPRAIFCCPTTPMKCASVRAYDVTGWEHTDKETIAKDIGEGRWHLHGKDAVLDYCAEDVRAETELLHRQLRGSGLFAPVNVPHVLHWSNYSAKCIARIQARGMPIDMALWELVQENKRAVIAELIRQL